MMPGSHLRPLHMAKSIQELNGKIDVEVRKFRSEKLVKSAQKLFAEAEEKSTAGNEESSYIFYMRFFKIVKELKSRPSFKNSTEKKQFDLLLGPEKIERAILRSEELSKSLNRRYEMLYKKQEPIEKLPDVPPFDAANTIKPPSVTNGVVADKDFIRCEKLNSLWTQKSESFLLIDIRSSTDFKSSSMKFSNVVSIPEESIRKGLTANACGTGMSANHKDLWSRRHKYDHLIICDNRSENLPLCGFITMVMDAMKQWDPDKKYLCSHPQVLKGGFDLFRLKYPLLVTNPAYEPASNRPAPVTNGSVSLNFDYPDLDTAFIETPEKVSQPTINRDTKPAIVRPSQRSVKNTNIDDVAETVRKPDPKTVELMQILHTKVKLAKEQLEFLKKTLAAEETLIEKLKEIEHADERQGEDTKMLRTRLQLQIADRLRDSSKFDSEYQALRKQEEKQNLLQQASTLADFEPSNVQEANQLNNFKKEKLLMMKSMEEQRLDTVKRIEIKRSERKAQERKLEMNKLKAEAQRLRIKENEDNRPPLPSVSSKHLPQRIQPKASVIDGSSSETYTAKLRSSPRTSPVRGGTNLRRSHSALNISQLHEENNDSSSMPAFDRTLKPLESPRRRSINVARHRNFEPKYGNVGLGRTGLKNLGNTCYMNSIVQCLNNTFPLVKYFHDGHYSEDINEKSRQHGDIAAEVGAVIKALWSGQYKSISMWDFKNAIGRYYRPFSGTDQQDAHELLIKLIDWLHEDLNLVNIKHPPMEEQDFDSVPDYVAARRVLTELEKRDDSIVSSVMHGLHRSVITCSVCSHRSLTFETFSVLTFSFVSSGKCSLAEMINAYYKESYIEYNCARCKTPRRCVRKMDIWKLPPILIVHLNRFEHDVLMKKNQNYVDFPLEGLNLAPYIGSNVLRHSLYNLYAVSNHYGTMDGGHYTAFCKPASSSRWLKYDDNEVYEHSRPDVRTSAAYILFYQAVNA